MLTNQDLYLVPMMDKYIDSLGEAAVFSTFNASSVYWQLEIGEMDCAMSLFTPHKGLYLFSHMLFGLTSALVTTQCTVDVLPAAVR